MSASTFEYSDFSQLALIKIFKLADILGITPKRASEVWLAEQARKQVQQPQPVS